MKIKFFNLDKIKIHITTRMIATIALITDPKKKLNSPNPETEIGPNIVTTIPPPTSIRIHIANKNPKRPDFKAKSPS